MFEIKVVDHKGENLFEAENNSGLKTLFNKIALHWTDSYITLVRDDIKIEKAIGFTMIRNETPENFFYRASSFKEHGFTAPFVKRSNVLNADDLEIGDCLEITTSSKMSAGGYIKNQYKNSATHRVNERHPEGLEKQVYNKAIQSEKDKPLPEVLRF